VSQALEQFLPHFPDVPGSQGEEEVTGAETVEKQFRK
jgi:hypothetical protein